VENRDGLIVNTEVFEANGTAERDAALVMLEQIPGTKQVTVGGDKGYDTADFVAECRNAYLHDVTSPKGLQVNLGQGLPSFRIVFLPSSSEQSGPICET
jgi:hypothetical protein